MKGKDEPENRRTGETEKWRDGELNDKDEPERRGDGREEKTGCGGMKSLVYSIKITKRRNGDLKDKDETGKRRIAEAERRQEPKLNKMSGGEPVHAERRKNRYLEDIITFRDSLLKSDIGRQIEKIIWFGSTLKGTAREDSDVDILIITGDGEMVRDRIADVLLDFQMIKKSPLEIVTSNIDELYPITDYFLKNVLTYGQEVYSMPEEDLKRLRRRRRGGKKRETENRGNGETGN